MIMPPKDEYKSIAFHTTFVILFTVLCVLVCSNFSFIFAKIRSLLTILTPIVIGLVIAMILNPLQREFEKYIAVFTDKKRERKRLRRNLSIAVVYVIVALFITALVFSVIPNIVSSYRELTSKASDYLEITDDFIESVIEKYPRLRHIFADVSKMENSVSIITFQNGKLPSLIFHTIEEAEADENYRRIVFFNRYTEKVRLTSLISKMLESPSDIISDVSPVVIGLIKDSVKLTTNILMGIIVSIYILCDKERLLSGTSRIFAAVLPRKIENALFSKKNFFVTVFNRYVSGKLLDAIIIWGLSYASFRLCGIGYALLLSLALGILNIIPYIGMYIGMLPAIFVIFVTNPVKIWFFIPIMIILIQIESRVIEPYILKSNTYVPAAWIIFSVILSGGLFGFFSMFYAAPIVTLFYVIAKERIENRLGQKNLVMTGAEWERFNSEKTSVTENVKVAEKKEKKSFFEKNGKIIKLKKTNK